MITRRVVNRVLAGPTRAAFKPGKLDGQARIIEQFNPLRMDERQQIDVQVRVWSSSRLVAEAVLAEARAGSLAAVAVADDVVDAVMPQDVGELCDSRLGIEARPGLTDRVEDHGTGAVI